MERLLDNKVLFQKWQRQLENQDLITDLVNHMIAKIYSGTMGI